MLGVYDRVEDIDLDELPEEFVLKPNHESGRVILCHDKREIDWRKQADVMKNWLRENYYYQTGEWQYKDIPPKILCEKMLSGDIIDYKFFCFNGKPVLVDVIKDRSDTGYNEIFIDAECNQVARGKGDYGEWIKPEHWDEMLQISKILSQDFPFVRVDLYDLEGKVYFGELTFTPADGMDAYLPGNLDKEMGELYDLSPFQKEFKQKGEVILWHNEC